MAIGYDNPGWTNGTAPALTGGVGGTLTALSDAVATLADAADSGASATATKLYNDKNVGSNWPTALLAALGSGWTTALAASATSGAANSIDAKTLAGTTPGARGLTALSQSTTLDADTVSGYGIGASALVTTTPNTALLGGFYGATGARTGAPFSWTDNIIIAAEWVSSTYCVQIGISVSQADTRQDNGVKVRSSTNGGSSWTAWNLLWNNLNDGNGGQPPAPKPSISVTDATPGRVTDVSSASTGTWYANGTQGSKSGTYWYYLLYTGPTGLVLRSRGGVQAGNYTTGLAVSAGESIQGFTLCVG